MRLSEAIRLRGMMDHQVFGHYLDDAGGSCALGGAALAIGIDRQRLLDAIGIDRQRLLDYCGYEACLCLIPETPKEWQALKWRECPERCGLLVLHECLFTTISHLNDDHHWSRERIADQVEIWEKELEAQLTAPPVEVACE